MATRLLGQPAMKTLGFNTESGLSRYSIESQREPDISNEFPKKFQGLGNNDDVYIANFNLSNK